MLLAILFESVGFGEWLVLLAVVLIVVGPRRLPETARNIGKWTNRLRRAAESFKRQIMEMDSEFTKVVQDAERQATAAVEDIRQEFNHDFEVEGEDFYSSQSDSSNTSSQEKLEDGYQAAE